MPDVHTTYGIYVSYEEVEEEKTYYMKYDEHTVSNFSEMSAHAQETQKIFTKSERFARFDMNVISKAVIERLPADLAAQKHIICICFKDMARLVQYTLTENEGNGYLYVILTQDYEM